MNKEGFTTRPEQERDVGSHNFEAGNRKADYRSIASIAALTALLATSQVSCEEPSGHSDNKVNASNNLEVQNQEETVNCRMIIVRSHNGSIYLRGFAYEKFSLKITFKDIAGNENGRQSYLLNAGNFDIKQSSFPKGAVKAVISYNGLDHNLDLDENSSDEMPEMPVPDEQCHLG